MVCPKCQHEISDQAGWCPCCGAAQRTLPAAPPKRRRSGAGVLILLIVCAVAAIVGIKSLPAAPNIEAPDELRQSVEAWETPPVSQGQGRGEVAQVKDSPLGSAGYLRGDVLLVSVYVDDEGGEWDSDEWAGVQDHLRVACSFLEKEAAAYGEELELCYDVQENPRLAYWAEYDGWAEEDKNGAFTRWIYRWIDNNVPVGELQQEYGTDNVGFLILLAGEGSAYTNVYYMEDSTRYYNENSVLFYYYPYARTTSQEVPGVYAHEILHMFGAIDLYEESPDFSPENIEYVAQTYPNDIMYGEYVEYDPDYTKITLEISPITAYYLGWLEELPQEDREGLSEYERTCVAGFSYEDPTFGEE